MSRLLVALQQAGRPLSMVDLMLRTGLRQLSIESEISRLVNLGQVDKVTDNGSVRFNLSRPMDASVANNREGTPA